MVKISYQIAPAAVSISHSIIEQVVGPGDAVIDATAGNGEDSVFLARLVGDRGIVWSFDIQEQAISKTEKRLEKSHLLHRVKLVKTGHENISHYVTMPIKAAIFNLGYLPGGDHSIVTKSDTTIAAVEEVLKLMLPGGVLVITVYWGHTGGIEEKTAIDQYVSQLSPACWNVISYSFPNKTFAPIVFGIQKKTAEDNNERHQTKEDPGNH